MSDNQVKESEYIIEIYGFSKSIVPNNKFSIELNISEFDPDLINDYIYRALNKILILESTLKINLEYIVIVFLKYAQLFLSIEINPDFKGHLILSQKIKDDLKKVVIASN